MIRTRTNRAAIALALATLTVGIVGAPHAEAGTPVRNWASPVMLDDTLSSPGASPMVTASHGTAAIIGWYVNGHAWVSERDPLSGSWTAKKDMGTASGPVAVAVGDDGSAAVAYPSGSSVTLRLRPAGATGFALRSLLSPEASTPRNVQVVLSATGSPTVTWLGPAITDGVRVAHANALYLLTDPLVTLGVVANYRLLQPSGQNPLIVWVQGGGKPLTKVQTVSRGAATNSWGTTSTISKVGQTALDLTVSAAPDGQVVLGYLVPSDSVAGLFTSTRSVTGTWSPPAWVPGTDSHITSASVAARSAGAAMLTWKSEIPVPSNPPVVAMHVTDRSSSASAWGAATVLPYIEGTGLQPEDGARPRVAVGSDGIGIVTYEGYGATGGAIASFVGHGAQWVPDGGLLSGDTDLGAPPLVLGDGTMVVVGSVVDFLASNIYQQQIREGRLFMTGPQPGGPATMTGNARVGGRVACVSPSWAPLPATLRYAWLRNGAVIAGATGAAYVPVATDLGKPVQCRITGTIVGPLAGSTAVLSNAAVVVAGLSPVARAGSVYVSGARRLGATLTCTQGAWAPTATYHYGYRWLKDGVLLGGVTTPTYVAPLSIRGHRLSCRVTASRAGYLAGAATSASVLIG